MKKVLIIFIGFYFVLLLQNSFFPFFSVIGTIPNFIFILAILINIFERPRGKLGLLSSVIGGFFLDIYSVLPIGIYLVILLSISILIKIVLKKYFEFQINPSV